MICPNCQKEQQQTKFCTLCGTPLPQDKSDLVENILQEEKPPLEESLQENVEEQLDETTNEKIDESTKVELTSHSSDKLLTKDIKGKKTKFISTLLWTLATLIITFLTILTIW